MVRTFTRRSALACALALALPLPAFAFPDQPIKVVVPTDPGGAIDGIARVFQKAFETNDFLPSSVVVLNMAGAGGTIGTRAIKDAEPDGYTIGLWHDGIVTSKAMGVADFDQTDFEIIGATGFADLGLAVSQKSDFASFEDMLAFAKENPKTVKVAANIGLPVHFVPMRVATEAGADLRYVQVGGGAKRYQSLLGGHTDTALFSTQELVQFQESGLRPILMLTEERVADLPDVPTAKELGIEVVAPSPRIWLAPKGTPADRLEILRNAFRDAMNDETVAQQLRDFGLNPTFVEADAVRNQLQVALDETLPLVPQARQVEK
ncbi:tripartite tricarboxylate transporter substrate binding protein [Acuticoccus sp. M5D2P5]|uniref:tripartite tricarboxylate transporter substrate binding protein n=1 Tax=Acuticoccus kalidii TaxID=2910977 RepID=UPI001F27917B|nr:tripartite tricarboxylate transporter substrate binding protein [Acuticoccus kalidii]MCF3936685.1 tripartite tricarboxylate transporter substrate binding protein [Acuticoccus kalidii]